MIYPKNDLEAVKMIAYADPDGHVRWERRGSSEPVKGSFADDVQVWEGGTYISRGLHGIMSLYEVVKLEDRDGPWKSKVAYVRRVGVRRERRDLFDLLREGAHRPESDLGHPVLNVGDDHVLLLEEERPVSFLGNVPSRGDKGVL